MRKIIIAGNWKMNKTASEAAALANEIVPLAGDVDAVDVVLCPPFLSLPTVTSAVKASKIRTGAQNVFWEDSGAFTGEVSADMILDVGAAFVILGHSERRQYFGETDETVNRRLKKSLEKGLNPIVCIGETLEQREADETETVIETQVKQGLAGIPDADMRKTVLAYEPVWAIGTGKTATPEQANDVHAFIRKILTGMYSRDTADAVRIQYGGSMKPENADALLGQPDIDGGLIGGASLKAGPFAEIVTAGVQSQSNRQGE